MRVLRDLADQRAPIGLRHPVVRLDLLLGVDTGLKARLALRIGNRDRAFLGVERLRVHPAILRPGSPALPACMLQPLRKSMVSRDWGTAHQSRARPQGAFGPTSRYQSTICSP